MAMALPVRAAAIGLKRCFLSYGCLVVACGLVMGVILVQMTDVLGHRTRMKKTTMTTTTTTTLAAPPQVRPIRGRAAAGKAASKAELKLKWIKERMERIDRQMKRIDNRREVMARKVEPNDKFHVFYYAWYESVDYDGKWEHWNHEYLKNWRKLDKKVYPTGRHEPPDDIGSNFYPQLGCYSSRDPITINIHMKHIRYAGIGVLIVSWYPPGLSDGTGRSSDLIFSDILNAAAIHGLKVSPHIEPYTNRNPQNLLEHLKYFKSTYGNHPALYKLRKNGKDLAVYYIYDSYRTPAGSWMDLLSEKGNITVRGTPQDGVFLGLLVDINHRHEIKRARFDGFYTYFASNGFSYGSTWKNWRSLAIYARKSGLLFSASIGPGYTDTRVRPWNAGNSRHRRRGNYYDVGWRAAMSAGVDFYSITSFNEWHEGTQIEPAVAKSTKNYKYMDYEPEGPYFYLNLTNWWINEHLNKSVTF